MKPHNPQPVAFFDVDGTVFRSAVNMEIFDRMLGEGYLSADKYQDVVAAKHAWKNRQGTFEEYLDKFVHVVETQFDGLKVSDYERLAAKVIEEVKDHQYRYSRKLMEDLRGRGYALVAISGMLINALQIYNTYLKFDHIYGDELEIKNGKFTDRSIGERPYYGKDKVVRHFMKAHPEYTLEDSYGIGDTEGDATFLALVDHPIAFNPNKGLFQKAREAGWPVIIERKDMVYDLTEGGYSVDI